MLKFEGTLPEDFVGFTPCFRFAIEPLPADCICMHIQLYRKVVTPTTPGRFRQLSVKPQITYFLSFAAGVLPSLHLVAYARNIMNE
jgi:hypothetical protein